MATVLIDKLLSACVKQGASDIHIAVGNRPYFVCTGACADWKQRRLSQKIRKRS